MPLYTDQTGRTIELLNTPRRIISLVPSQTELLFDLGLQEETIGITKFCVHPRAWFSSKTRVGGTKNSSIQKIQLLSPDLIIANKEENEKEQLEALMKNYPVWVSDVKNIDDAYAMIGQLGSITAKEEKAKQIIETIKTRFLQLPTQRFNATVIYLIWQNPYMAAGGDTFIHSMLSISGYNNAFSYKNRYPETSIEEIKQIAPNLLLLSSEPYPFKEKHIANLQELLPSTKIKLVDGEMFSWYGSRLLYAADYFKRLHEED